jgi:hypothetical protein
MFPTVSKEELAKQIGITPGTIVGWMKRDLTNGVHYVVKGHTTLFYVEAMTQWLNGLRESDRAETECKSESGGTANLPTRKRSRATPSRKLTSPVRLGVVTN